MELPVLLGLAFGAAVATFFAPCAYALLPGYVGYYVSMADVDTAPLHGAILRGLAATIGVLLTFGALSVGTILAGSAIERLLPVVEPIVGIVLVLLGTYVVYHGSISLHLLLPRRRSTVVGFGSFGAMYAIAATACVLPLFLAIVIQSLTMPAAETALVLGVYGGGFGALMLSVTIVTALGYNVGARRLTGNVELVTRIAGIVIILAGLGQMYVAFTYAAGAG